MAGDPMQIRKLSMADYDELYALWASTAGMGLNDVDDARAGIEKYLKRNPDTCFVAVDGGRIVGGILAGHDGRRGSMYHAAVAADCRNRGIGSALVDAAETALRAEGIRKVSIVAFRDNHLGNAFWEHAAFSARDDLIYRNKALTER